MSETKVIAKTPKINFSLNISNISKLNEIWSPEYLVQGIPWKVKVCKRVNEQKESLGVYLYCAEKEKPENWSHVAFGTFKLLPFNNKINPVEYNLDPHVFDNSGRGIGTMSLIDWQNLLDVGKYYVKNDNINLDIKIGAADPDEDAKSKFTFEHIESGCGEGCVTSFRLSVTNIEHLIAVRSPTFNMRKLRWDFSVYKSRSSMLSVCLKSKDINEKISFKSKASVKLISSEGDEKTVEVNRVRSYKNSSELFQFEVGSWDELFKPENGFVKNNSIIMEVLIIMTKPEGVRDDQNDSATSSEPQAKVRKMECPICLKTIGDQEVSSTKCGHLFCKACITNSINTHGKCPSCNAVATMNDLHPIYLPFTK
ncbi:uncharacterized protein LOC129565538 [Sitodiplosis mosellana]|uniref:uncharacterized protein LOC129565538 n=1 Tax=Sitodiplosis mosellana TaxID=263140 RepID=UPI002445228B|nr:uncharacterized protein LOC129565538 [Sitodiplosis mosellana]